MGVENRILCRRADNAAHQAQSGSRMIRDSAAAHRSQGLSLLLVSKDYHIFTNTAMICIIIPQSCARTAG
jgi:hypothetical protein